MQSGIILTLALAEILIQGHSD